MIFREDEKSPIDKRKWSNLLQISNAYDIPYTTLLRNVNKIEKLIPIETSQNSANPISKGKAGRPTKEMADSKILSVREKKRKETSFINEQASKILKKELSARNASKVGELEGMHINCG